jgi:hypothetical protein
MTGFMLGAFGITLGLAGLIRPRRHGQPAHGAT